MFEFVSLPYLVSHAEHVPEADVAGRRRRKRRRLDGLLVGVQGGSGGEGVEMRRDEDD